MCVFSSHLGQERRLPLDQILVFKNEQSQWTMKPWKNVYHLFYVKINCLKSMIIKNENVESFSK